MRDDDRILEEAARAVAAGNAADWTMLQSSVRDDACREALDHLRQIAAISEFHGHLLAGVAGMPPDSADAARESATTSGEPWGSLTLLEELGRGSFGRVYRAWDPRLEREVALKLLDRGPSSVTTGVTVIEEGRLLARLRNPNIVMVHGADTIGGRVGIEMELIVGRTLHDLVQTGGPLGADEATVIARSVCRGLAAIHRAGLVHRDVKAQNVMREQGGRIVLMDLGAGSELATPAEGPLAGTPLYLAPEILAGGTATPRSDLYSVGVLLFFLTTGTYPHVERSLSALREAHCARRARRLRDVRPDLPERFIQVVERALAPDPLDRFDSAGSFEAALAEGPDRRDVGGAAAGAPHRSSLWFIGGVATLALLAGFGVWKASTDRPPGNAPIVARFVIPLEHPLTVPTSPGAAEFALAPDGSSIAYSTHLQGRAAQLHVRNIDAFEATSLAETGDSGQPFFSPDGQSIGYHQLIAPYGKLAISALSGGTPRHVADWIRPAGASWSADGTIVYSASGDLWRISEQGGTPLRLTTLNRDGGESAIRPQALENGIVLFTHRRRGQKDRIAALTAEGEIKPLLEDARNGKYVAPGYLVFQRDQGIAAAAFQPGRLAFDGPAVDILPTSLAWFDVSSSGTLVFSAPDAPVRAQEIPQLVWADVTGKEIPIPFPNQDRFVPGTLKLSPDGAHIAVAVTAGSAEVTDGEVWGRLWIGDVEQSR